MTQTEIHEKLMELRRENPVQYGLDNIGYRWDEVNSRFKKHGADEEFLRLLSSLKEYIKNQLALYGISRSEFKKYKTLQGYNFNYGLH